MTRWNLVIPEKTDRAVRIYLARTGGKKGDLSRFVDEAVRRRVLDLTVRQVKDRNSQHYLQEILSLTDADQFLDTAGNRGLNGSWRLGGLPGAPVDPFPVSPRAPCS